MEAHDDTATERRAEDVLVGDAEQEATPAQEGTELRPSRKREREVSLEPGTPQPASTDPDAVHTESKDRRTPAKKNRISAQLDSTQEEEESGENASTGDQEMSHSPPTESRIRQISQGVEDLTWKNMQKASTPDLAQAAPDAEHAAMETEHTTPEAKKSLLPAAMIGENPPLVVDDAGLDEQGGEADLAEVPPDGLAEDSSAGEEHEQATPPPESVIMSPQRDTTGLSRRGSDSSIEQEKGVKRKMGNRTVSERRVPEDLLTDGALSKTATTAKRPRDDPDADENPRVTKRPTPPPDEETEAGPSSSSQSQIEPPPSTQSQTQTQTTSGTATPRQSGFMAYASTSSPFASVKGPSLFASPNKPSPWTIPNANDAGPSTSASSSQNDLNNEAKLGSPFLHNVVGTPSRESTLKRSGFEAFASAASPFASAAKRPKSPPPAAAASTSIFVHRNRSPARHHSPARALNAFSAYATGGMQSFSTPSHKRSGSGSPALSESADTGASSSAITSKKDEEEDSEKEEAEPAKKVSFGERLRAGKDDEEESDSDKKLDLKEQELHTGEEDEDTVYQVRGKLFALSEQNQWKERGTGQLKVNIRREDGAGARLLMRKEAVYTVLLNAPLFKGMRCTLAQDPRYIRFSVLEGGVTTHYNLRVSNAKIAAELLEEINTHIP